MLLALSECVVRGVVSIAALLASCAAPSVVSVLPVPAQTTTSEEQLRPLRVTVDATSTHLPLAVAGSSTAYGDVDRALTEAIEHALAPLSRELTARNARQLGLAVELVEARAEYSKDRMIVRLAVRATLRENSGNVYLAQTHAHASASAVVLPEHGARVVLESTDSIGHQLSGWLSGMDLH